MNRAWSGSKEVTLCFRIEHNSETEGTTFDGNSKEIVNNSCVNGATLRAVDTARVDAVTNARTVRAGENAWWIENRMCWGAIASPDLEFPVAMKLKPFSLGDIRRFGDVILSKDSDSDGMNRLLSCMATRDQTFYYRFNGHNGNARLRIRKTNDRIVENFVVWSHALDKVIGVQLELDPDGYETLRSKNCVIFTSFGAGGSDVSYAHLDNFTGLENF
jgi:hypothetical protein